MMIVPQLCNNKNTVLLPKELFSDFQIDKILSENAINILQRPCGYGEIVKRNELFVLLDRDENHTRLENALSVLSANERALYLSKEAKISIDRYYRYAEVLASYVNSCECLASMHDLGSLFSDVAAYFSSEVKSHAVADIRESAQKIKILLQKMNAGLLSFSDKNWLTPDYDAVSEFDCISKCAEDLGFTVSKKKTHNTRLNLSMSDTICRLYKDEVAQIEDELAKYDGVDFYEPVKYIPEIKFLLEMQGLIRRAATLGIPHCISKIASSPKYIAKKLYDVSLLAKRCENIIPNDADFTENEPFCFLLGANGGGKTTYLRAVGINLILFLAGCPVFAKDAEIYPFGIVLSHFPKDERFDNTGRLDEERMRVKEMLTQTQNKSAFLIFNETFSGTDDMRGFELLTDTAKQIRNDKHFGLYVTHFHEVMRLDYLVLSAEVDPMDENKRTFRIVKTKVNTSSYASDILKKYRLDKDSLATRRCENDN